MREMSESLGALGQTTYWASYAQSHPGSIRSVSYTHLDVYKRQILHILLTDDVKLTKKGTDTTSLTLIT